MMATYQKLLIEQLEQKIKYLEEENCRLKKNSDKLQVERMYRCNVPMIKYCNHLWKKTFTDSESESLKNLRQWFLHMVGLKYSTLNFNERTEDLKLITSYGNTMFETVDDYFCGDRSIGYVTLQYHSETLPEFSHDTLNASILDHVIYYIRRNCNLSLIKDKYLPVPVTV